MVNIHTKSVLSIALLLLITACGNYRYSINEQPIRSERALFRAYDILDKSLARCVAEHIYDQVIYEASALTELRCADMQIKDISGIASFADLEAIDLSGNQLIEIDELVSLSEIRYLNLKANQRLECAALSRLNLAKKAEIILPKHCK